METKGIGIDPGTRKSGIVVVNISKGELLFSKHVENDSIVGLIWDNPWGVEKFDIAAIERIRSYGHSVGNDTYIACEYSGVFREAIRASMGISASMMSSPDTKVALMGSTTFISRANARKAVTQAMMKTVVKEKFSATGGGKDPYVGTKKAPGPLYDMPTIDNGGGHCWSALILLYASIFDNKDIARRLFGSMDDGYGKDG